MYLETKKNYVKIKHQKKSFLHICDLTAYSYN